MQCKSKIKKKSEREEKTNARKQNINENNDTSRRYYVL